MQLGEFFKQNYPSVLVNAGEAADGLGAETEDDSIAAWLLGIFGTMKRHRILFLTKGTLVRHLINTPPEWHKWAVLTWSLNASIVAARWERGAPAQDLRLKAAKEAYDAGFEVQFIILDADRDSNDNVEAIYDADGPIGGRSNYTIVSRGIE